MVDILIDLIWVTKTVFTTITHIHCGSRFQKQNHNKS